MDKIWDDMLYPNGVAVYPDADTWKRWRKKICTDVGGLAEGFRSELILRGYKIIEDMTGNVSFLQAWVLAITGRLPTKEEDRLLNAIIINTTIADPRFWFNRTARLAATVKSSPAGCMAAGIATKDGEFFSSGPAYNTAKFFSEALQKIKAGETTLEKLVKNKIEKGEIITGFGRVLARGKDERNDALKQIAAACNLDHGDHLKLAYETEKIIQKYKSSDLYMNSGGLRAGLLLDMGFNPHHIMIFYTLMLVIGMAGNICEAYERMPGEFLPLTDDDIEYTGHTYRKLPAPSENQSIVFQGNGSRAIVMDSVSYMVPANRGDIIVTGSHGGESAARHAMSFKPKGIIFNDAGMGKNHAGIQGLSLLNQSGILGAGISHESARIGDGRDGWMNGIISVVNDAAKTAGISPGMTVQEASRRMINS